MMNKPSVDSNATLLGGKEIIFKITIGAFQ